MKIGFDFRMGGTRNAGIGRYSFELLDHLLDLYASKHQFIIFYNPENVISSEIESLKRKGAQLVEAPYRHYSWQEQILFVRLLNRYKLDLVHFPNFNVPIFYRGKFVVTIHDMVHHKISGHKKSTYYKFLIYKYIINFAARKSEFVITVTESAKNEIVKYLNIEPRKIIVTLEAPGRKSNEEADFESVKSNYGLNRPYLLFVGTLERKKNIVVLCQAFDLFLEKYKFDLDLVIAGKVDPHYPEIKDQSLLIKHNDHLLFTGFTDNDVQSSLYKNAFAFITASLHEGFGLPAVEAMQYGIPVLASNTEVFNEVYDNAAIYFDPLNLEDIADKINLLVSDLPFHEQMQQRSIERSRMFDWVKTAQLTMSCYEKSFHNNSPSSTMTLVDSDNSIKLPTSQTYEPENE